MLSVLAKKMIIKMGQEETLKGDGYIYGLDSGHDFTNRNLFPNH